MKYKADGSLDRYTIGTAVANTSLDNYDVVVDRTGTVTLKPVPITITNEMVQTYGSSDKTFKEVTTPTLVNGDAISTVGLSMTPKAGGAYETNRDGRTTADAGTYKNDLESDGGGIVHEDGSDARKNYSVTIEGDIIVNKAPLEITTKDVRVDYGTDYGTTVGKTVWDGDRDRGGDRPEDKRVVTLPFFKVLEDKTTHRYGTYDVAKRTTEVKIAPSAQVLPEPNQPATQYRELDTELTTDKGTGEFTLKYNGSRFTILPDDDAAAQLIVVGDETKNRDFFEKALHVAFTKMGLEVADLDGVYIHFGKE